MSISIEVNKVAEAAKKKYGEKPLLTAASKKDEQAVMALLAAGYEDLEECDMEGYTTLVNAAVYGLEGCVKALLSAGADKDSQTIVSRICLRRRPPYG